MNRSDFIKRYNLVDLAQDSDFLLQIVYATTNNFTGQILYPEPFCFLRRGTYDKLKQANRQLKAQGRRLIIWDAWRPLSVQRQMWQLVPDERFVTNPDKQKSIHCKGSAVDVTLADLDGNALSMPTKFDYFGPDSFRENLDKQPAIVQANVNMLTDAMVQSGFQTFPTEWWHFNDSDDYPYIEEFYQ